MKQNLPTPLKTGLVLGSRALSAIPFLLASALAFFPVNASGSFVFEAEPNGSRLTATPIPDAAFDLAPNTAFRNATNNPAAPRFRTVGLLGININQSDVDFFSFTGNASEQIYIDGDNDPAILCLMSGASCNIDIALVLFSSTGAILAVGDNNPPDTGSALALDPFIGVFTLPTTDTYFLAVVSGPLSVNFSIGTTFTPLTRPDGLFGGAAVNGSADNSDQFGSGELRGGYLVWVSRSTSPAGVPEPATLALLSVALAALGMARGRKDVDRDTGSA